MTTLLEQPLEPHGCTLGRTATLEEALWKVLLESDVAAAVWRSRRVIELEHLLDEDPRTMSARDAEDALTMSVRDDNAEQLQTAQMRMAITRLRSRAKSLMTPETAANILVRDVLLTASRELLQPSRGSVCSYAQQWILRTLAELGQGTNETVILGEIGKAGSEAGDLVLEMLAARAGRETRVVRAESSECDFPALWECCVATSVAAVIPEVLARHLRLQLGGFGTCTAAKSALQDHNTIVR